MEMSSIVLCIRQKVGLHPQPGEVLSSRKGKNKFMEQKWGCGCQ